MKRKLVVAVQVTSMAALIVGSACQESGLPGGEDGGDANPLAGRDLLDVELGLGPGDLVAQCLMPNRYCGSFCIDPLTSASNCGGCGTACGAKESCENGVCGPCKVLGLHLAATSFSSMYPPADVVAGHVSGMGSLDIAWVNVTGGATRIDVLVNMGMRAFGHTDDLGRMASGTPSIALGDLNSDGLDDCALAESGDGNLSIWTAQGRGNLMLGLPTYQVGSGTTAVVTANLNSDHFLDVAVANSSSGDVAVLLNQGLGALAIDAKYPSGGGARSLVTGDWDGDGKNDLAVANEMDGNISVMLNVGAGGFAKAVHYGVGQHPWSIVSGDFDGDGKADLAVANNGSDSVAVLLNLGGGVFGKVMNFPAGVGPQALAVGDFDLDGKADLAVADTAGGVAILVNTGGGVFAAPMPFKVGNGPTTSIIAGDLDSDGKVDLAVTVPDDKNVVILFNASGSCR